MNDLGYNQVSNPNESLKLVLMCGGNHWDSFFDIFTILAKDFIPSHSLSPSPQVPRVDDIILTTQSSMRTLCHIKYMIF